ncbi:MAG: ankyrin repeat domain-containing protein [Treponema sp.]|nr:ankyrin repeat domain-containing protein [Treponema sp.]
MKKKLFVLFLIFLASAVFANDYKWDLVNALLRDDYPAAERLISQNINRVHANEKRLISNFAVTYPAGETTLRVLTLLQRFNVNPSVFDLYTAINRGQSDQVVQFILSRGVSANGEILHLAMERQRYNIARVFILSGADVNYQYPLSSSYSDGMSPLMYASKSGNFELTRLLLDHGADINARNREGNTAYSLAEINGNAELTAYLSSRGALETSYIQPYQQQAETRTQTSAGIAGLMNLTVAFMPGTYRLSNGTSSMVLAGASSYGTLSFIGNNKLYTGSYQSSGNTLTLIMEGQTFIYRIDSSASFSGNGETWTRFSN